MQIIFHIDLDAFFASAEVINNPSLKGKPLVVSGTSRRSIVSTASYEARKFGIHSAMPLYKAKELCDNLIVVSSNFKLYRSLSNSFFNLIYSYTNIVEPASIDECYIDMTDYIKVHNISPLQLAKNIQDQLYEETGLSCSIGISPNKFLAKMASDIKKPHGITLLTRNNLKEILWPLPVGKMYGIGKKTAKKLIDANFNTIKDIANYDNYTNLKAVLGNYAIIAYRKANGIDNSPIVTTRGHNKSISNARTFEYDVSNVDDLYEIIANLTKEAVQKANKDNLYVKTVGITLKYNLQDSKSKQAALPNYLNEYEPILSHIKSLFDQLYDNKPIRLVSVSLNDLKHKDEIVEQISIFEPKKEENEVDNLIKDLNKKLNEGKLIKASQINKHK